MGFPFGLFGWTPWLAVEHTTNEKYTQIMTSFKKSKQYLSDSHSGIEITDFLRFIIIKPLYEMKLDQKIISSWSNPPNLQNGNLQAEVEIKKNTLKIYLK